METGEDFIYDKHSFTQKITHSNMITYSNSEERDVPTELSHTGKAPIIGPSLCLWGRDILIFHVFKDSSFESNSFNL